MSVPIIGIVLIGSCDSLIFLVCVVLAIKLVVEDILKVASKRTAF